MSWEVISCSVRQAVFIQDKEFLTFLSHLIGETIQGKIRD